VTVCAHVRRYSLPQEMAEKYGEQIFVLQVLRPLFPVLTAAQFPQPASAKCLTSPLSPPTANSTHGCEGRRPAK